MSSNALMRGKTVWVAVEGSWREAGKIMRVPPHPRVFVSYRTLNEVIHEHETLAKAKTAHAAWWAMSVDVLELIRRKEVGYTNIVIPKSPQSGVRQSSVPRVNVSVTFFACSHSEVLEG